MGPTKSHMGESERDVPNVHCILHCNLQCALCTARPVTRSKSQDPCLMARSLVICNRSRCFYEQCKRQERQRCNNNFTASYRPSLLIVGDATTHISRYKYITGIQKMSFLTKTTKEPRKNKQTNIAPPPPLRKWLATRLMFPAHVGWSARPAGEISDASKKIISNHLLCQPLQPVSGTFKYIQ